MPRIRINIKLFIVLSVLISGALTSFVFHAKAASLPLTLLSDQLSRAKKGTASDHTISFRTSTGAGDATDTIVVTMPDDFTLTGVDYSDIDLFADSSNPPTTPMTLAATADATKWGVGISSQVITFTHPTDEAAGDIAANDYVIIEIGQNATGGAANAQITNHATAGSYIIKIDVKTGSTVDDTGQIAIRVVDDDQVVVDGIVDPSITFSLSANATSFGIIATNSVKASSPNIVLTVGTNGENGYTVFVNDVGDTSDPGLYNTPATKLIASKAYGGGPSALSAGTEGYGIRAQGTSGTPTIDAEYDSDTAGTVGGLTLAQQRLAYHDGSMSSNDGITVYHHAAIAATTEAGSYFDTITYVASGRY